jgi:hypothetical protein
MATTLYGFTGVGEGNQRFTFESSTEADGTVVVVATTEGLADDSLAGAKHRMRVRHDQFGAWERRPVEQSVRCQQDRGHQEWTPEPCT